MIHNKPSHLQGTFGSSIRLSMALAGGGLAEGQGAANVIGRFYINRLMHSKSKFNATAMADNSDCTI